MPVPAAGGARSDELPPSPAPTPPLLDPADDPDELRPDVDPEDPVACPELLVEPPLAALPLFPPVPPDELAPLALGLPLAGPPVFVFMPPLALVPVPSPPKPVSVGGALQAAAPARRSAADHVRNLLLTCVAAFMRRLPVG